MALLNKMGWIIGAPSKRRMKGRLSVTRTAFPTSNAATVAVKKPLNSMPCSSRIRRLVHKIRLKPTKNVAADHARGGLEQHAAARTRQHGSRHRTRSILSAEENPNDSLVPRLAAAGADLSRVHVVGMVRDHDEKTSQPHSRMFSLVNDLEKLRRKIVEIGDVVAVLIDPVSAYLGVGKVDSYRDSDVRAVLGPLKELAEEMQIAVITVMHFNKKQDITNALLRVSNSLAFVGLPRHVYSVVADVENMRKLFVRAKNNDAAESDNQTLAYHFDVREVGFDTELGKAIRAPFIVWEPGYVDITATEAMQAAGENKSPGERDKAKDLLLTLLAGGAEVPVEDIKDTAEKGHGISWRTMKRAKNDLKIVAVKDRETQHGKWFWKLPQEGNSDGF
jgi:putative DNA primase/helicase